MPDPVGAGLSAAELDTMIRSLVARRASLQPGHPAEPPNDPAQIYRADNMLWHVRPAQGAAAVEMLLYHPGLGWTSILMSRAQIEDLQDAVALAVAGLPLVLNGSTTA